MKLLLLLGACAPAPPSPDLPPARPEVEVSLTVDGVGDDGVLSEANGCGGASPGLQWTAPGADVKSAAWLMEVQGLGVVWIAWNPEGPQVAAALPASTSPPVQSWSDAGPYGYVPPCLEAGEERQGRLLFWALSTHLPVPPTATREELMAAIAPRVQGRAEQRFLVRGPAVGGGGAPEEEPLEGPQGAVAP